MAAVIALDVGTKRTGVAVVDALRIAPRSLPNFLGDPGTAQGLERLLEHLAHLFDEREVDVLLVSMPFNMDGTKGPRAEAVETLIGHLRSQFQGLCILARDERLTTKEAEARLVEAGHTGRARKERRDAWSALVILEQWMLEGEPRDA